MVFQWLVAPVEFASFPGASASLSSNEFDREFGAGAVLVIVLLVGLVLVLGLVQMLMLVQLLVRVSVPVLVLLILVLVLVLELAVLLAPKIFRLRCRKMFFFRFMHGHLLPPAPLLKLAAPPVAIGCVNNMSRRRWGFDSVAAQKYVFESDPAVMYVSLPRQSSQQVTEESAREEWCRDMAHIF